MNWAELPWVEMPVDFLDDVETVLFFILLAKIFRWDITGWVRNNGWTYWIVGYVLVFTLRVLIGAIG